jgi:hypothetical protein
MSEPFDATRIHVPVKPKLPDTEECALMLAEKVAQAVHEYDAQYAVAEQYAQALQEQLDKLTQAADKLHSSREMFWSWRRRNPLHDPAGGDI